MIFLSKIFDLKSDTKQLFFYYGVYCFLFILVHLLFVSVFSFFHFLLDHEMGTIENWISRNTWEIVALSKLISLYSVVKLTQLNYYGAKKFKEYFSFMKFYPTVKSFAFVLFILIIFYSLIVQFGGGIKSNQFLDDLFLSSFLGSLLFYALDMICIFYLKSYFDFKDQFDVRWGILLLVMFLFSSKIILPYLSKYLIFLIVHFLSLYYLGLKKNLGDMVVYLILIVAPMSSLFGMDLVWDNSFAIFTYNERIPVLGIIGIWCVALGYYRYSKLN